jgi:hypothetical protein
LNGSDVHLQHYYRKCSRIEPALPQSCRAIGRHVGWRSSAALARLAHWVSSPAIVSTGIWKCSTMIGRKAFAYLSASSLFAFACFGF